MILILFHPISEHLKQNNKQKQLMGQFFQCMFPSILVWSHYVPESKPEKFACWWQGIVSDLSWKQKSPLRHEGVNASPQCTNLELNWWYFRFSLLCSVPFPDTLATTTVVFSKYQTHSAKLFKRLEHFCIS